MSLYGKNGQSKEIKRKLYWKSNGFESKTELVQGRNRVFMEPLGIDGRRINVRTSNTFVSNIFEVSKGKVPAGLEKNRKGGVKEGGNSAKSFRKVGKISDILAMGNRGYGKGWNQGAEEEGFKIGRQSPMKGLNESRVIVESRLNEVENTKIMRAVTPSPPRALSPSSYVSLEISSKSELEIETLRDQLKGYQIISMVSPYSLITRKLSNSASVKIKTSDTNIQTLINKLEAKGLNVNHKIETIGRKNLESIGIIRAHSPEISRSNSRSVTRHHLETTDDLFGSSPGVGKFEQRSKTPDKQAVILHSWDSIRKPPQEKFLFRTFTPGPNYMKSTKSWSSKSKQIFPHF